MRLRGAAVFLALLLAFGATIAVFLYVKGVRQEAKTANVGTVAVIVSKVDLPVGTKMDTLITQGAFTTQDIPQDALVQGVVTDLGQIRGQTTSYPILAGEQISTLRFQGTGGVAGGPIGIPDGFEAITLPLETPRQVGGILTRDSHVTIFATFATQTIVLVPDAVVLKADTLLAGQAGGNLNVTLALKPADAQKAILAQEAGKLWFSLLPPNQRGQQLPPLTVARIAP
jgi:Flp pilus assembly protein CpaB